jgi:YYY domain-containing protein
MEFLLALRWFLAFLALAGVGLPLAAHLFPRAPSRGAAFALPTALAVLLLAVYWLGHVTYNAVTVAAAVVVLVAAALAAARRVPVQPRALLAPMAVFLGAFALLVAVRAVNPAIVPAGGEKFLDSALLNSILRADALPPEDPWFAGEPVRYYYGGHLLAATLARLTATSADYAYNLALAGFYATLVTTAYGLAAAVADAVDAPPRAAGVLGAFLVGFAGNLATPARKLLALVPDALAREYGRFAVAGIRAPTDQAFDQTTTLDTFHYWNARYVIPDTLNPFPLWAYFNGDLNAYMLSTPFLLLAAALAFAYYRTPAERVWRRRALAFGALPAVAGLLAYTSTWSYPTACGLAWLAAAFADAHPASLLPSRAAGVLRPADAASRVTRELSRLLAATLVAGVVALAGAAWASPYLLFHTPVNRGVGFLPPRSPPAPLLLVHGVFLAAFALYLTPRLAPALQGFDRWQIALGGVAIAALLGWLALAADLAAVAVFGPLLVVGWLALRQHRDVGFETVLLVAAVALALVVEFAYARVWPFDPNAPRWNTVYKVYMQVWVLWGPAAAVAATRVLDAARDRIADSRRLDYHRLAAGVLVVLVVASGAFPAFALGGHFDDLAGGPRDLTLDGTAYVEYTNPHEAEAIEWLDARRGQPTMVSRPGRNMYVWRNAPASLTGVPTLLGWRHEKGYRGAGAWKFRARDVELIYTGDRRTVRTLLRNYDIEYVYVGPNERERYDVNDFSSFPGVSPAFRNENVTVYRVNQSALAANATAPES